MGQNKTGSAEKFSLKRFWYGCSVKAQLLIAVGVINVLAAIIVVAVAIPNARLATSLEVEASLEIAQRFVDATTKELAARGQLEQLSEQLPFELRHLRHVRIMIVDSFGNLAVVSPQPEANSPRAARWVPKWFKNLVAPKIGARITKVTSANRMLPVIIVGEPSDEIAEAWEEFSELALVWLVLNALVLIVLWAILGRLLDPLISLSRGLHDLEDGDYATRLKPPRVKEIASIANRFNTLAGSLESAREENSTLYRQLISVQERERREIANELHDEAGPCLFGITANASSVKTFANRMTDGRFPEIEQRADEILGIAERLKMMNRALLKELRPGPLGQVKLDQLLNELIAGLQHRHPAVRITASISKLADSYGEALDLTLYRCVQEGIANALESHKAGEIVLEIGEQRLSGKGKRPRPMLYFKLVDDGSGFTSLATKSFVLATMTERVRSLGGDCLIEARSPAGASIRIEIPLPRRKVAKTRPLALVRERS
ncbi:MAG: HAMP domain-containing protein [Alphaproteobacteria bacterium]|nr:HAMP domain-containing protein [Alphaproteobacteria bacterium]